MRFEILHKSMMKEEGFSETPYVDRGTWTIAFGHSLENDPSLMQALSVLNGIGIKITREFGEKLLEADIFSKIEDAQSLFPELMSNLWDIGTDVDIRQLAAVGILFQLGKTQVQKDFKEFYLAIRRKDYDRAANEILFVDGLTQLEPSAYFTQTPDRCSMYASWIRTNRISSEYLKEIFKY